MPTTNLTNLEVNGVPTMGLGGLLPFTGNCWFVNPTTGSDGFDGSAQFPFATITQALKKCVGNANEIIFLTGTYHTTATINWNLNFTHLIGLTAPSDNCRARISATGATAFSPLVNVTGNGCIFLNLGTFHGGFTGATGSQVCWNEAGGRNFYGDVQFLGGGDATTAALAGMRSLTLTKSDENKFYDCTIGLDTIVRATNANASLELLQSSARNIFRNTVFQALISDTSDVHVTIGADGLDRYVLFDNCSFLNAVDSTSSTMAAAIVANAAAGGSVLVQGGLSLGATAVATTGPVYVNGAVPAATTSSIAIKAT